MDDVEIIFEREGAEGIVAVGTYLGDAASRLGVKFDGVCVPRNNEHFCQVSVTTGSDLLSEPTENENQYFETFDKHLRLACQTRIEKSGEVRIMIKDTDKAADEKAREEAYKEKFAELPLEKKIAELVQLEAIAFSDTVSFVINSPYKIADKVMDVMAEFGFRGEEREKADKRPSEHRSSKNGNSENGAEPEDQTSAVESEESKED